MFTPDPATQAAMHRISALLQAGEFRTAQEQLEAVIAAHPRYVEALRLLAGSRQALGDPAAAEALLRQALALDPGWTPTLATLGELLLAGGRAPEAENLLERAATGTPAYPRAAMRLARWYNDTGRPARALAVIAPFCARGKVAPDLAAQHIAALAALGRADEAAAHYRSLASLASDDLDAAENLAQALAVTGRHAEAAEAAAAVIGRGRESAALHAGHARSLVGAGDPGGAEAALRRSIALDPRRVDSHNHLAQLVWMRTGDAAASTAELDRALTRFAHDDALWAAKAAILQAAGDARAALACLEPRLAKDRAPPMLLVRAALAALDFDPAGALPLAERAVAALPGNPSARTVRIAAWLGVGEARRALPECEALRAAAPDDQYLIALETTAWRLIGDARYEALCDHAGLVRPAMLEPPAPWTSLGGFIDDLRASLAKLHDPNGHPLLFQSLRGGTETLEDLSRSGDPVVQALFKSFAAPIEDYLAAIGRGTDPLRRRNQGRWRFNGGWSVSLRAAGHHRSHVHPRGWISSAFYVSLPDSVGDTRIEEGILSFGRPSLITQPPLEAQYSVRPRAGMLTLFPSYFWHGTTPFSGNVPRLTVAFDAVPP
jgi:tetratricopeptide (TPR) repeat protein